MNIRNEILKNYSSEYEFAVDKKVSPQLVNYWCKKGFKNLRLDIQDKVVKLLGLDIVKTLIAMITLLMEKKNVINNVHTMSKE